MKKVRLGIIGIGNMGTGHINNIKNGLCPEIEVTAVADSNPDREEHANKLLPEVPFFASGTELMYSKLVDAVLIAVPHYDHPTLAIAAMERGLPVMVEKPAGVYTNQVRLMNEVAERTGVIFGMMFNQRTHHTFRKMKEIIDSGELGEIRRTNWIITDWYRSQAYYDSGAWRATWSGEGGGVLLNQCPHNLDLWQWICGMPSKVQAHLHFGKWHDIEVEDDVTCYVEYPNGATGVFITSTGDAPGTNRFEVTLDGGKLIAENNELHMYKLEVLESEFTRTNKVAFGQPKFNYSKVETDGESQQHVGILNAFAGAILRGEPLIAEGYEGINGLTLSNAMHLSAWTESPVDIPFNEDLFEKILKEKVKSSRRKEGIENIISDTAGSYGNI